MFNKSNFCHIASNNRNEQKGSVFIYKTADTLAQVTQSGYFNEKLIDINVHDLIIHVQYNPVDRTLKKSVLIVTERTLDNVETAPILDQTIGDDIADLGDQVQGIEEKIPGAASAANQLADKAFVNDIKTAIETTIAGINTSISTLNNDLSQTNQNLAQTNQNLAQTNQNLSQTDQNLSQTDQNVDSLQETKQDKATAVNYNNITNCITEIPQDIKLELNNGTLTLKAGSKVYVPNGFEQDGTTPKFDTITIASDLTMTSAANTQIVMLYLSSDTLSATTNVGLQSGSSYTIANGYWYDTTNNLVKRITSGSVASSGHGFPLAVLTTDSTQITSIDQVFNGFGYIGSTIFVLPGVKGLIPDGRNADGTLKSNETTRSSVLTRTYTNETATDIWFNLQNDFIGGLSNGVYNEAENLLKNSSGATQPGFVFAKADLSDGKIQNWKPYTAFHALDYIDTEYIAHQAMPSKKYINLTLGASGSTYTAPADGYFYLKKAAGTTAFVNIFRDAALIGNFKRTNVTTDEIDSMLPCKKGDVISVTYSATGATVVFRFYFAEGAKHLA